MYKVGGFLFTFHGAGRGESLLSAKKKFLYANALEISCHKIYLLHQKGTCSRSQSPIWQWNRINWSLGLQLLVSALFFNISAKMRRVANLYVYLNLRRWFPLKLLLRSFFSIVLSNKVWSLLIYSKGINNRRQNGKVCAVFSGALSHLSYLHCVFKVDNW